MELQEKTLEQILKELGVNTDDPDVKISYGHTLDNRKNLPPQVLAGFMRRYHGTRTGDQELAGKILDEVNGALWTRHDLDLNRLREGGVYGETPPLMRRIVVGVDPMVADIAAKAEAEGMMSDPMKSKPAGSETGIIVVGLGINGHGYVLDDLSISASPLAWANKAIYAMEKWGADRMIAEVNNGGALVETTVRGIRANIPYKAVQASRGKITRAEPVAALYEQHMVHHVGLFPGLEDQLVKYTGDPTEKSPDRLDALVWAITELMLDDNHVPWVAPGSVEGTNQWRPKSDGGEQS